MKRLATLVCGVFLLVSGSGCCCPLFGMRSGYGGGCQPYGGQPYGGQPYGAGFQQQSPGGCGGAYAPNAMSPTAYYSGAAMQASVPYQYQATALNPLPAY